MISVSSRRRSNPYWKHAGLKPVIILPIAGKITDEGYQILTQAFSFNFVSVWLSHKKILVIPVSLLHNVILRYVILFPGILQLFIYKCVRV